ncbi:MAG: CcmD family protein [Bacteroidetes bacterium]|nr:CcmD family protein [Bacteroidota bacterium]MBK9671100.1 CcmD family protein [Bacteroidota bacterium]MBK9798191.1 CcmD family protein [Bacteroidota bacterium]MBP6413640.1 CcmD family protein [Bacteroidia bacterium]
MNKFILFLSSLLISAAALAQEAAPVEMADTMRSSGKIYVVVTVLLIIFVGIVIYLSRLDSKLSKLEKELKK